MDSDPLAVQVLASGVEPDRAFSVLDRDGFCLRVCCMLSELAASCCQVNIFSGKDSNAKAI